MYCLMAAHVYVDLWKETGEFLLSLVFPLLAASLSGFSSFVPQAMTTWCGGVWASSRRV